VTADDADEGSWSQDKVDRREVGGAVGDSRAEGEDHPVVSEDVVAGPACGGPDPSTFEADPSGETREAPVEGDPEGEDAPVLATSQ
jgi:hypothetical protein